MRIASWYLGVLIPWFFLVVPFWYFATSFNGASFFSLPTFASPSEGEGWLLALTLQVLLCLAMLSPLIALPFAIEVNGRTGNAQDADENAQD